MHLNQSGGRGSNLHTGGQTRLRLDASIGKTPLRELRVRVGGRDHRLLLKLESQNGGGGSIKARTVRGLLDHAAAEGRLAPGATVVESSSGNFAVALAIQARARGLQVIVVLDPNASARNVERVLQAGARVECVSEVDENGGYLLARLERVQDLLGEDDNRIWTNQYGSPANPDAHYYGTGMEIVVGAPEADAIMVPCSTGGTAAGIAARVRASGVPARVVPVDIPGSHALRDGHGRRLLTGIGSAQCSVFVRAQERDRALIVSDELAIAACRTLEEQTALSVGGSSGAALIAALRWLDGRPPGQTVVVVCPDGGGAYDFGDAALARLGLSHLPSLSELLDDLYLSRDAPIYRRFWLPHFNRKATHVSTP
ncbi:MAG TPA: pyridoxal-phosphate dependent enzyme [Solirubrobacteraceae bacterium]|nr:pyridoxal-phosphate dependent enzyme [Solirubrobacteraceae bacterium]